MGTQEVACWGRKSQAASSVADLQGLCSLPHQFSFLKGKAFFGVGVGGEGDYCFVNRVCGQGWSGSRPGSLDL